MEHIRRSNSDNQILRVKVNSAYVLSCVSATYTRTQNKASNYDSSSTLAFLLDGNGRALQTAGTKQQQPPNVAVCHPKLSSGDLQVEEK